MKKININLNEVRRLYIEEELPTGKIAELLGVSKGAIRRRLREADVPIRTATEGRLISYKKGLFKRPPGQKRLILDEQFIKDKYLADISITQIAHELNCSVRAIQNRIQWLGIYERGRQKRLQRGMRNPRWKGGRKLVDGYVYIYQGNHRYIPEHRLIWETTHSKSLPKGWVIHHLNGIRNDNRPENLVAFPDRRHRHIIGAMKERIHVLEDEVKHLKGALERNQAIFYIEGGKCECRKQDN